MLLILFLLVAAAPATPYAEADPPLGIFSHTCGSWGADRMNTTFEANLEKLSLIVPANASVSGGFFKGSLGAASDTVYTLALCRGDTIGADCVVCLDSAFQYVIIGLCGYAWDVTVYLEQCHVRFANVDFLAGEVNNEPTASASIRDNITLSIFPGSDPNDPESIAFVAATVSMLMRATAKLAAYNASKSFATVVMDTGGVFPTQYSMAQCTPDLSPDDCFACLEGIVGNLPKDRGSRGRRILGVRCSIRYESDVFYSGKPMWIFGPTLQNGRRSEIKILTVTVVLLVVLLFCMIVGFWWIRSPRKGKVQLQAKSALDLHEEEALVWTLEGNVSSELLLFDFAQIKEATSNFSEDNKLGQGGFGPVYKGKLPDGLEIAVKRLCTNSGQGFIEFRNEVQLIAKLQHTNLVRLLGCCCQRAEKLLVYEYLPNKSLDLFIFDSLEKRALLDWKRRLMIIQGIAQGLLYLHKHSRLHIIHRDLKASNILLDGNMNPKISDFGIAKIFISNDIDDNTNTVIGTCGYMAPEYAYEGNFSSKSDVFSFGVLLLEIVSGKRNSIVRQNGGFLSLLGYAWLLWKDGKWHELVDTSLVIENCMSELFKCITIALLCVQENAADRPTMWDVTTMLSTEGARLPEPNHPAYYKANGEALDFGLELHSINEVTITAEEAR